MVARIVDVSKSPEEIAEQVAQSAAGGLGNQEEQRFAMDDLQARANTGDAGSREALQSLQQQLPDFYSMDGRPADRDLMANVVDIGAPMKANALQTDGRNFTGEQLCTGEMSSGVTQAAERERGGYRIPA